MRGLSVGLARTESGFQLREVSLTATPRVANAQLFGTEPPQLYIVCANEARGDDSMETRNIAVEQQPDVEQLRTELKTAREHATQLEARVKEMAQQLEFAQSQLVRHAVQRIVEKYQREGKLTPAAAERATQLLMHLAHAYPQPIIQFSEGTTTELPEALRAAITLFDALPARTTKPAVRTVSLDDAALAEHKQELAAALRAKGFSFAVNGEIPDELVQIAANLKEVQS